MFCLCSGGALQSRGLPLVGLFSAHPLRSGYPSMHLWRREDFWVSGSPFFSLDLLFPGVSFLLTRVKCQRVFNLCQVYKVVCAGLYFILRSDNKDLVLSFSWRKCLVMSNMTIEMVDLVKAHWPQVYYHSSLWTRRTTSKCAAQRCLWLLFMRWFNNLKYVGLCVSYTRDNHVCVCL